MTAHPGHTGSAEATGISMEALAASRCVAGLAHHRDLLPAETLADPLRAETVAGSRPALVRDAR
ncbi:aspartate ammonia-lyase [Streptomyces tibetensis]|uniref:aspartate ammonia-lyase n=1 Tax=Streptomyces tibetensis TaxID=2382123 RepID=UPI0033FD47D9